MDRTLRTKYDFEFEKVYIRPKREERKKSYLFTVLVVIGLVCFFFMPLLALNLKTKHITSDEALHRYALFGLSYMGLLYFGYSILKVFAIV